MCVLLLIYEHFRILNSNVYTANDTLASINIAYTLVSIRYILCNFVTERIENSALYFTIISQTHCSVNEYCCFLYYLNEQTLVNVVRNRNLKIAEILSNECSIHTFSTILIRQSMFFFN